jgi:L-threonylcarbamoyladenylate synthase
VPFPGLSVQATHELNDAFVIETKVVQVSSESPDPTAIREAARIIQAGGLVCFPTETVYGLGADALSEKAVQRVFVAKGRPTDNPLIVHIADPRQIFDLADENLSFNAEILAKSFWPGPLTLIMRRTILVPDIVTAGLETVAIRMPDHRVALALINEVGSGIVGPSANLSGRPSPTIASDIVEDLRGRVDMILDAGETRIGVESTVVDVTSDPPAILRLGGLSQKEIEEAIGPVVLGAGEDLLKKSPGTRHRHYAPEARVVIIERGDGAQMMNVLRELRQRGQEVGCIVHSPQLATVESGQFFHVLPENTDLVAHYLFRTLRELDRAGVDVILVESVSEEGVGAAVMDRIRKAAAGR